MADVTKASPKLLPCPFCGANPHHGQGKVWNDSLHGDRHQDYNIWCPHQCAKRTGRSRETATEAWNTRAYSPSKEEAWEAMVAALTESRGHIAADLQTELESVCVLDGETFEPRRETMDDDDRDYVESIEAKLARIDRALSLATSAERETS